MNATRPDWWSVNFGLGILIKISLNFLPKGPINSIPALVQIMAWRRIGDKPLSDPVLTHWCIYAALGRDELTHWSLRDTAVTLNLILPSGECHETWLMISQHWSRQWLGDVKQLRHWESNFGEILIKIHIFSFNKMHLKMLSGNGRPFCLGLNMLLSHVMIVVWLKITAIGWVVENRKSPLNYLGPWIKYHNFPDHVLTIFVWKECPLCKV